MTRAPSGRVGLSSLRTTLLAALITLAVSPTAAAAGIPHGFFGIQAWTTPTPTEFSAMGEARVGTYRAIFDWAATEPTPGARNWAQLDSIVSQAALAGIHVLPVIIGSPAYAAPRSQYPPVRSARGRNAFAGFLQDVARRYGNDGTFWQENPALPARPIKAWQIWNEPNLPAYWFGHPKVSEYVRLLKLARTALRSADPRAKIVIAGIPDSRYPGAIPMEGFFRQLYAVRGAKAQFDVVAVHPYAGDKRGLLDALQRVHAVMTRHRDGSAPIWVTEMGWATGGKVTDNTRRLKTTVAGQAQRLTSSFKALLSVRSRYRLGMVVWFSLRDRAPAPGERNWWAIHTGLLDQAGKPKPAWQAYRRFLR